MKYTNDLKCHDGKWYARIEFVASDTIPAGCLTSYLKSFNVNCGSISARDFLEYSNTLYAPIKVPEGFPEKWSVLKDGNIISSKTIAFQDGRLTKAGDHAYGEYSKKCKDYPEWPSVLMFNPISTPQENFANAEKSGIVDAFKNGKVVQSSRDGKNWSDEPTPNFCSPLQWRVKRDPIKPPVFDWRPIEEHDGKKVPVFLKWADLNWKIEIGIFDGIWRRLSDNTRFNYTPTHFTVIE